MNLKFGTFLGVPLYFNWSAFLVLAVVFALAGPLGLVFSLLGFLFVVAHEYGHVWVAQSFGWEVNDVTIYMIGGIANMKIRCTPKEELCVGVAGPIVSFILFLFFTGLSIVLPPMLAFIAALCAIINFMLVAYNLLPILPMDGGRILRASLAMITDHKTATWWTVRTGEICGFSFAFIAFYFGLIGMGVITVFMVFISWVELSNAEKIYELLRIRNTIVAVLNSPELTNATVPQLVLVLESMDQNTVNQLNLNEPLAVLRQSEHLSI